MPVTICTISKRIVGICAIRHHFPIKITTTHIPKEINKIGIITGFGLKNPEYVNLAIIKDLDILISGDLTQQTAILAKNSGLTLIDLNHHESEVPGLYALRDVLKELDIDIEVIDKRPIEKLK